MEENYCFAPCRPLPTTTTYKFIGYFSLFAYMRGEILQKPNWIVGKARNSKLLKSLMKQLKQSRFQECQQGMVKKSNNGDLNSTTETLPFVLSVDLQSDCCSYHLDFSDHATEAALPCFLFQGPKLQRLFSLISTS